MQTKRKRESKQLAQPAGVESTMRMPFLLLVLFLLGAKAAWSQHDVSIVVTVINEENHPLPGARVKVFGTQRGAIANPKGIATVTKLEKGKNYDLEVAIVGFYFDTIRNVVAGSPESKNIRSILKTRPPGEVRLPEQSPEYLRGRQKSTHDISHRSYSRDSLARIIIRAQPDTTIRIRGGRATETE